VRGRYKKEMLAKWLMSKRVDKKRLWKHYRRKVKAELKLKYSL